MTPHFLFAGEVADTPSEHDAVTARVAKHRQIVHRVDAAGMVCLDKRLLEFRENAVLYAKFIDGPGYVTFFQPLHDPLEDDVRPNAVNRVLPCLPQDRFPRRGKSLQFLAWA